MLLDIGVGILLAIFTHALFGIELNTALIALSIGLALLPDIDIFPELIARGTVGGKVIGIHRTLTHYPILYTPFIFLIFAVYGVGYGVLLALATLLHFIHDSIGTGWGIKWLWPFSKNSYKFFSEKDGTFSSRFFVSWVPQELVETVAKYGDPDWFKKIYLRPHPVSIIEFIVFLLSLLILYFYLIKIALL